MAGQVKQVQRNRDRHFGALGILPWRGALILSVFVLLGFAAGFFVLAGGPKAWKSWRTGRLLNEAAAQLDQGKIDKADDLARRALAIDPNSIAAARVLAEATEKENRPETVTWRAQIARLDPKVDNQLNLASAALRFGQLDLARRALKQVPAADREKAAYQVVAGWLSRAEGNLAEEERHFARAVEQEPSNDTYQFNLAVLQIHSPDPAKVAGARQELERLTKVPQFRTEALRALLEDALGQKDTEAANDLAQQLQMSPEVTFADYLLCLDFYRRLNPKKFDALLEKVKPAAAHHPEDVAQLIKWMNQNELAGEALHWSDKLPDNLTNKPPVAEAIAASLALTKNFSRLKRWTQSGSWGEEDYLRLAYHAYAVLKSRRGKGETEFKSLWRAAETAADGNHDHQVALARLASKWNLTQIAEALWQRVAQIPTARREALDALYRIYREENDLPNLALTAQRLHEASPEEAELAANAARFVLLRDRNNADARELSRHAYEKAPNDTAVALTYAFALYGNSQLGEAMAVLKRLEPEQLHDPHAAVYAAFLFAADNETALADQYLTLAKANDLFPEEKPLLEDIKKRRAAAVSPSNDSKPSPSPR